MARNRSLRPCDALWVLLSLAPLVTACGKNEGSTEEIPSLGAHPAQSAHPADRGTTPTAEERTAYLTWSRDWGLLTKRHLAQLDAMREKAAAKLPLGDIDKVAQDPDFLALLDRQRKEMQAHMDRMPKGAESPSLNAMYLNAKFEAAAGFAPSAAELEAFVTGAGGVRLGMAENEVTAALGKNPTRREVASSPGAATEVAWEDIPGARPGAAHGRLADGRLVFIEFTTAKLSLPRVSRAVARSLTESADLVRRSVAKSLRMQDIEVITHTPGQRVKWSIGLGDPTTVVSYWLWEVEPGGEALFVEEENGVAGQPITRPLR